MKLSEISNNWQTALVSTDTVYGIVSKVSEEAIEDVYKIKGRDKDKPLILFGSSLEVLKEYSQGWTAEIEMLAREHWAGPLTIILPKSDKLPDYVNPGFDSIGLRIPDSPSVMGLLEKTQEKVLLSTSANISGEPEITNYDDAIAKFDKFNAKIDLLLEPEAGELCMGQASTIVSFVNPENPKVLRMGSVKLSF